MKKILVLCKGTGQSTAFKKAALEYVKNNNIDIEWAFADDTSYEDEAGVDFVLISPEMLLVEAKLKKELEAKGLKYMSAKPADFGLRRVDSILKTIEPLM